MLCDHQPQIGASSLMNTTTHSELAAFIWKICNLLRGPYKRNEYRQVILPLTVLRRFDCVLADTKQSVIDAAGEHAHQPDGLRQQILESASGCPFYNTSEFDFGRLLNEPNLLAENLTAYKIGSDPQRWQERVTPAQVAASSWRNDQNPLSDSDLVVVQVAVERVLRRQRGLRTTSIDVRHGTEFNSFSRHTPTRRRLGRPRFASPVPVFVCRSMGDDRRRRVHHRSTFADMTHRKEHTIPAGLTCRPATGVRTQLGRRLTMRLAWPIIKTSARRLQPHTQTDRS